jgi:AAA+ superfamily predicted ATPase
MSTAFDPKLRAWLDWLRRLLAWQMAVTRVQYAEIADDPHRGLYISDGEADALVAADQPLTAELLQERRDLAAEEAALTAADDGRLAMLAATLGLNRFERLVLLLTFAPTVDQRYERIFAYIQDDATRKRPTVDLALRLLTGSLDERYAAMAYFDVSAPLRRLQLLRLHDDGLSYPNLIAQSLQLAPRLAAELLGLHRIDGELLPMVSFVPASRPVSALLLPEPLISRLRSWLADGPQLPLVLEGPEGSGRSRLTAALAAEVQRPLLAVDVAMLRLSEGSPSEWCARIQREALLQRAVTLWHGIHLLFDGDAAGAAWRGALLALLQQSPTAQVLTVERPWRSSGIALQVCHEIIPELTIEQRLLLWQRYLRPETLPASALDALAGAFRLTAGRIRDAVAEARRQTAGRPLGPDDLAAACRTLTSQALGTLARKVDPTYSWDDLVLPDDQIERLRDVTNQMRNRRTVLESWGFERHLAMGKGIIMLFSGESGTGKTMAAEIIARELGLQLYTIDLSSLVSKYIGETEKNLERIFSAATEASAVLFFDEADAIFGKRSEVKDAHDRYANIEVGYLLQRIESYSGVVILATNLRKNVDTAFLRRLHSAVDFPRPKEDERLRIWQRVFPSDAPLAADVDRAALARRYDLSGGNIRNVALSAAYLAAADSSMITMQHLLLAVRREYQKSGRLMN